MNLKRIICTVMLGASMTLAASSAEVQRPDVDMATQKKELKNFRKKYKLKSPEASQKEVEAAMNTVELFMLKRIDEYRVEGRPPYDVGKMTYQQGRDLAKTVRALAYAAENEGGGAKKDLYLLLDYLSTERVIEKMPKYKYSNYNDIRRVLADFMSALPSCDDYRKSRLISAVMALLEADQLYLDDESIRMRVNSDYIYNVIPHLFLCAIHNPDEEQALKDMNALSHFLSACTQYSPGGYDILKPDGTGFHHHTHYNGYMYSYQTWVEYMGRLKGTSFRIEKDAYERMKKAVVSVYLMAVRSDSDKNRYFANSMAGRHPFTGLGVNFSKELFATLIEVGGDVYGVPYDKELASYYNFFYKTRKYADAPEVDADGFYQFNYSPAGIYRKDDWVAVMRCPTTKFWGGELYSKTNRFGRYQSHGTLEILYEGGLGKCGYPSDKEKKAAGWDWNMMPGSTTVHYTDWNDMLPNRNDADRFDQWASTSNFAGALAWKDCGLFAAAFDQDDKWGSRRFEPTNLRFCKSVFAIDGMLFDMGNGISAKGTYPDEWITATNLFQTIVTKDCCMPLNLNGREMRKGDRVEVDSRTSAWVVNPVSTGYYIPEGHDPLVVIYEEQTTPSSDGIGAPFGKAVAAKSYLNHGVKPEGKGYRFLVVPSASPEKMAEIAARQDKEELFKVLVEQDSLHVVKYLPSSVTAYAIFAPVRGLDCGTVCASETGLLVMERPSADGLELALCSPDLRPETFEKNNWVATPTDAAVELKGSWAIRSGCDGVTLEKNSSGNTVLKTTLKEGGPVYVSLVRE